METLRSSRKKNLTIASGATVSDAFQTFGMAMFTAYLPSTFDGTTMTFQVAPTFTGTYVPLEDATGNAVTYTVEASAAYALPEELAAVGGFKLVAGTAQTTTDTVITITARS